MSDAVFDIQILDDGRVLVGGAFEFVNGSLRRGLIRLNAGTLTVDTAFAARPIVGGRWSSYHVRAIALDSTGAVFVSASDQVHRLREDGTTEYSFFSWANINVEQIAFDAQDRPYVLTGWPSSLGPNVAPSLSGLVRFDDPASNSVAPGFASPQIAGRGARMILSGERLILLGSMRSSQTGAIGALALSAESGAPAASLAALGTTENVALYGAIPIGSGGTLVFGEFTHAVSGSRLWGTLRLNAQGQRIDGPFMDFFGTPDAFSLTPDGNLLYTSLSRPMPRPQDWGEQFPEGEWIVGGVRVNDGARLPWDTYSNINLDTQFKSGIVSHDDGPLLARRNSLRSGTGFAGQNSTSTGLPFGTTRRIAVDASGFAVLDRGPPPPNAFSSVGGVGFWPPPSSSPPVRMLYRWLPGPGSAIGLGPDRSAPLAEVGGFDVHRASGVIYASFPGQTTAQPPWSIRRIDPAGAPEGEVLSTLADHWAPGGLALDEQAQYAYLGGFGPLDSSGNRPARVFRVATTDGEVDPEWPRRGGDAVQAKWIYMVGDQVFALSATASGTYAAFYRTDGVLFEDGFEQ
ncbi:MAG: delta-60 repeat domain-containing protein [Aquimonas sp.]|nr:delta-60 repeat domain-containing protein [Aquimonas sp.]